MRLRNEIIHQKSFEEIKGGGKLGQQGAANAIGAGVHRIDHPDSPITLSERISRLISPALMQPGMSISDWLRGYSDSRVLHATLELLNSLLWGAIIALIVCRLMGRRASTAHSHAKNPIRITRKTDV